MNIKTRPAILSFGLLLVLAACGGATAPTASDPDLPRASIAVDDTLPDASASPALPEASDAAPAGPALAGLLSPASIEALLGELPEPACEEAGVYATESCEWANADGSVTLELELSRDEAIGESVDAFDDHMATVMESGERVDGVGESAFIGANPLSPGVRIAAFVGDGAHIWVTILAERDRAELETAAVDLATELVAAL